MLPLRSFCLVYREGMQGAIGYRFYTVRRLGVKVEWNESYVSLELGRRLAVKLANRYRVPHENRGGMFCGAMIDVQQRKDGVV